MAKKKTESKPISNVPVNWQVPPDIVSRYATNIVIQHGPSEFIVSFFEARPPLVLGTPAEVSKALANIKGVDAVCVARIVISPDKMPDFIDALKENYSNFERKFRVKS